MRKLATAAAAVGLAAALGGQSMLQSSAQTAPSWSQFHSDITRDGSLAVSGPNDHFALSEWSLQSSVSDSPVIASSGIGYIADDAGNVYRLDPASTGNPSWTKTPGGKIAGSPALSPDGTQVLVASADGNVYDLNSGTGATNWTAGVGSAVSTSPLVSPDGSTVYVSTSAGSLYALNTSNGNVKWSFAPQEGAAATSPTASPDGTVIYFGTSQRFLYGVPSSGPSSSNLATTFYLGGTPSATPAVDRNGNIYVPEQEGTLELFAPTGGAPRWTYTVPGYQPINSTPAITSAVAVLGGASGYVYGVSINNGVQSWQTKIGPSVVSSPALATTNSHIYIGSNDGGLYAIDPSNGNVFSGWPDKRNQGAVIGSPALGPDGAVWYAPHLGDVYRVGDLSGPSTPPAAPTNTTTPVATNTPTATSTPEATSTPVPTNTPTLTPTPVKVALKFSRKSTVQDGQTQTIKVTSEPRTVVHIRVNYPNGDHQSHKLTTNGSGKGTYSYKQGASKVTHKNQKAQIVATAGSGAAKHTVKHSYKIKYGAIDVSVEPRTQSVGKSIKIFVHAASGTKVTLDLLAPSGKIVRFSVGKTGPKGFATYTYKVQSGLTKGSNHTVKALAAFQKKASVNTATTFKVK